MGKRYDQLDLDDRIEISRLHAAGKSRREIGHLMGRDAMKWAVVTGYLEMPVDEHPKGRAIRFKPHPHLSGRDGGRTIDLRRFALDGVRLHGRVMDAESTR